MSCIPCLPTKALRVCTQSIVIGTAEITTEYTVYITNLNSGHTVLFPVTSNGAGLITVDISTIEASFFNENSKYKIVVSLEDESIDSPVDITIDSTDVRCFIVPFIKVLDADGLVDGVDEAILELDLSCDCI